MRALWLVAVLACVPGCLDDTAPPAEPVAVAAAVAEAPTQSFQFEGRYRAVSPAGNTLQEEGGVKEFQVAGWKDVEVTFDANIDVGLWLLPPGCASIDDDCALRHETDDDGVWTVGDMEAGAWTAVVRVEDDYFVEGSYEASLEYVLG